MARHIERLAPVVLVVLRHCETGTTVSGASLEAPGFSLGRSHSMVMAGTLLATIPLIVIFLVGSRQFVGNITAGALKG